MKKILLFLTIFGCSAAGEYRPEYEVINNTPEPVVTDTTYSNWVLDPELVPYVQDAAIRWSNATCLDIEINNDGTIWFLVDSLELSDGKHPAGLTGPSLDDPAWIQILRGYTGINVAVLHEMGHRLNVDHQAHGVMVPKITRHEDYIDIDAVTAVCEKHNCGCFAPEQRAGYL